MNQYAECYMEVEYYYIHKDLYYAWQTLIIWKYEGMDVLQVLKIFLQIACFDECHNNQRKYFWILNTSKELDEFLQCKTWKLNKDCTYPKYTIHNDLWSHIYLILYNMKHAELSLGSKYFTCSFQLKIISISTPTT